MIIYPKEKYICCEDCECMISAEEAAPGGLCYECYTDRIIDDTEDSGARAYLSGNRYDFINFLRGSVYEY